MCEHVNAGRSLVGMFSITAVGKHAEWLTQNLSEECFGDDSFWDRFHRFNGTVCNLNHPPGATFIHERAPLGTDADKSFIDRAPCLIVIFAQSYGIAEDGGKIKHYYAQESVGIATGFLIAALHHAGLACLTHTPSPMSFLSEILNRPPNERAFINLVVGYPAEHATVPTHALYEKHLHDVMSHR